MSGDNRIILAADELTLEECLELAGKIGPRLYAIKIHNLYDQHGPGVVRQLLDAGAKRIWVDAKLHDIPNTVSLRATAIANSGATILSVHSTGGEAMIKAAVENGPPEVFAVTVLTSLGERETFEIYQRITKQAVLDFAILAKDAGAHGVVCSPQELRILRAKHPKFTGMKFIVPGIRSVGQDVGDQKRVGTPTAAIWDGASHLVIGRQITQARDPAEAYVQLRVEIAKAEAKMPTKDF